MRLLTLICLLFTGCASVTPSRFPLPSDPIPTLTIGELESWGQALEWAEVEGSDVYKIMPTGSMEPTLFGGDYVTILPKPFKDYQVTRILHYDADWIPPGGPDVIHRAVGQDSGGFIMSGDNNPFSEAAYRVTEKTAKGELTAIWRVRP